MTSPLNALIEAAHRYREAECFVVSQVTWTAIENDMKEMHFMARDAAASAVYARDQMTVMGVPVTKTRVPGLANVPFLEVHTRDMNTLEPVWVRIL